MLIAGQIFNNRYLILRLVAEGSHANVYMAQDQQATERMVAVKEYKVTSPRPEISARFESIARALEKFNHPYIARVYEHVVVEGIPYLVTEFVIGGTFEQQVIARSSKVPEEQVTQWGVQLCDALDYLHCQVPPIYLLTLRPDNIMVTSDGTVKLIDYGLSAVIMGNGGGTMALATPGMSAPEEYGRVKAPVGPYTDVYSLGIMLLRLATGYDPGAALVKIPRADKLNPSLSRNFAADIAAATAPEPTGRYPNMQVFKQALLGAPVARSAAAQSWLYVAAGLTALLVVGAIVVVALILTGAWPGTTPAAPPVSPTAASTSSTSTRQPESTGTVVPAAAILMPASVVLTSTAEAQAQVTLTHIYHLPLVFIYPRFLSQTDPTRLELPGNVAIILAKVPAGPFQMGSSAGDTQAIAAEKPKQSVNLGLFYIGKYEVTNAQFAAFAQATGYKTTLEQGAPDARGDWRHPQGAGSTIAGKEKEPVVLITWEDAMAFCKWASQVTGRKITLPSEAMWEKAARGKNGSLYPWGNQAPDETRVSFDSKVQEPWPVGQYSPDSDSPYGVSDMASNVQEWTSSLWQPYPYRADDGREDPSAAGDRVMRGGSFVSPAPSLRAAWREANAPEQATRYLGFRVVEVP